MSKCRHDCRFISQHTHPAHIYEVTFMCVCVDVCVSHEADFGLRPPPVTSMWPLPLSLSSPSLSVFSLCHFFLSLYFLLFCRSFLAVITLIHFLLLARLLHSLWLKKAFIYPVPLGHTHTHTQREAETHSHPHSHTFKRWYGPALPRQTTGPDKLRWHQSP